MKITVKKCLKWFAYAFLVAALMVGSYVYSIVDNFDDIHSIGYTKALNEAFAGCKKGAVIFRQQGVQYYCGMQFEL